MDGKNLRKTSYATEHITPACNNLNAFINKVNEDQTSGQLKSLQAANLIQQAKSLQKAIGCSSS